MGHQDCEVWEVEKQPGLASQCAVYSRGFEIILLARKRKEECGKSWGQCPCSSRHPRYAVGPRAIHMVLLAVFMPHSPWRTPPFTSTFASWVYKGWLIFRATISNMGAITIPYLLPLSEPQHLQNPVPHLSHVLSSCPVFCYLPWTSRISSNYSKITRCGLWVVFQKLIVHTPSMTHGSVGNAKNLLPQEEESPVLLVLRL